MIEQMSENISADFDDEEPNAMISAEVSGDEAPRPKLPSRRSQSLRGRSQSLSGRSPSFNGRAVTPVAEPMISQKDPRTPTFSRSIFFSFSLLFI